MDDPFSGRDRPYSSTDDVEHAFGDLVSSLVHNFQPSPSSQNYYIDGCLGMLDGQTLSEAPFVRFLRGVEDTHSPNFSNFLQVPLETSFTNHESSSTSLGEHVSSSSHGGNDNKDLMPWMQSLTKQNLKNLSEPVTVR